MNKDLMFSSKTNEHSTPQDFFEKYNAEFGFTLDAAATTENAKCQKFFTKETDALTKSWANEIVWMNPPYSEPEVACKKNCNKKRCARRGFHNSEYVPGCIDFMKKAYNEAENATVVCLVAARTDNTWFHEYALKGELRFIRGRLKFGESTSGAPFPSLIVVFRNRSQLK